jgi:large subunit ribosomal protein L17
MSIVREKDVVHKIFEEASERFGSINGGYTRIVKIGRRPGDAAAMTLVELVSSDAAAPAKTKKTKVKIADKPAATDTPAVETASVEVSETTETPDSDSPDPTADVHAAPSGDESGTDALDDGPVEKNAKASADPDATVK